MSRSPAPGGGRRRYVPDWPANFDQRKRRLGRTMLVLGALIVLSLFATPFLFDSGSDEAADPPAAESAFEVRSDGWYLADRSQTASVTVAEVIDGDTLDARAFGGEQLRVRLFGADAPELDAACYQEATARLRQLAAGELLLLRDERLEDDGGRQLRYAFTPGGRSIEAALVDEGLATAWRRDGAFRDQLVAIEEAASDADRGCLWRDG